MPYNRFIFGMHLAGGQRSIKVVRDQGTLIESNTSTQIKKYYQKTAVPQPTATIASQFPANEGQHLKELEQDLLTMASTISKVSVNDIDLSEDIGEYGFDSISFTEFANRISDKYQLEITRHGRYSLNIPQRVLF